MENKCKNCGICCLKTEMIIAPYDIEKIREAFPELKKKEFCQLNEEDLYQLNNINGHCYFFDISAKRCKIYEYRPKGCRFYPLIYSLVKNNCIFDKSCPRTQLFYKEPEIYRETCQNLKRFIKTELNLKIT